MARLNPAKSVSLPAAFDVSIRRLAMLFIRSDMSLRAGPVPARKPVLTLTTNTQQRLQNKTQYVPAAFGPASSAPDVFAPPSRAAVSASTLAEDDGC